MAIRSAGRDSCAEGDPDWLGDLPTRKDDVKSQNDTIPQPPIKPRESPEPRPESDMKRRPRADAAAAALPAGGGKPALGDGFKLQPEAAQPEKSDQDAKLGPSSGKGDSLSVGDPPTAGGGPGYPERTRTVPAKPALPGLEAPAENSPPAPERKSAALPLVIPDNP